MDNIIFYSILFIPIIDMFVNLIAPNLVGKTTFISQILISLIFFFRILIKNEDEYRKIIDIKTVLILILLFLMFLRTVTILQYDNLSKWNAMSIFIYIFVLYFFFDKKERVNLKNTILEKEKLINCIFILTISIIILTIIRGSGIEEIWGVKAIKGPYTLQHYLAYNLVSLLCLARFLQVNKGNNFYIIYILFFLLIIALTGVRSILPSIAIIFLLEFINIKNKKIKIYSLVGTFSGVILIYLTGLYKKIPIISKFINTFKGGSISNGRNVFWIEDIKNFFEQSFGEILFGKGSNWLFELNEKIISQHIHAHNDYINVMIMFGLIAVIIFIILTVILINYNNRYYIFFVLSLLSFMNGLYTYEVFVITIPFILVYMESVGYDEELDNGGGS